MLALQAGSGRTAVLAFGAVLGLAVFVGCWRRLRPRFPEDRLGAAALVVVLPGLCVERALWIENRPYAERRFADQI